MLTASQRKEMIEQIRRLPSILEPMVASLSDLQLDTPYGEGKWTIRQVVHHLADAHCNCIARFKMTLTEDNPTLKTYDQDKWAELVDSRMPVSVSLDIIRGLHARMAEFLSAVDESGWRRKAYHPEDGEYTLCRLVEVYANHGEKHLGHIRGLLEAKGWG